jgi:hypothetical protein
MKKFLKKYLLMILLFVTVVIFTTSTVKFTYNANYQKTYIIETNYKFTQIVELSDAIAEKLETTKENISIGSDVEVWLNGDEIDSFKLSLYDSKKDAYFLQKETSKQNTPQWVIYSFAKNMSLEIEYRLTLTDLSNLFSKIQLSGTFQTEYISIDYQTLINPPLFSGESYLFSNFEYVALDAPLIGNYICINYFINFKYDRSYEKQIKYYFELV